MTATRRRIGVLFFLLLALVAPQAPVRAATGPSPTPSSNPDLDATCGLDLADLSYRDPATLTLPAFPSAGATNWDDALELVRRSPAGQAPLAVVITDGNPTRHLAAQPDGHGGSLAGDGAFPSTADLDAAVTEANLIRQAGTHLFVVGVGAALSDATSPSAWPTLAQASPS